MDRSRELVEDMKNLFRKHFSTPSITEVPGEWYLFNHKVYNETYVKWVNEDGLVEYETETLENYRQDGWTVTPVMVHVVNSVR